LKEEYAQKLLLTQEKERKRIAKDLHDGLGQSLLIIKNKLNVKDIKPVEGLVVDAIEEMRNISRTLYPFQLENVGLITALKKLINQLDSIYEDIYLFGDFDEIKRDLSIEQEVNIFRIIQEGVTNIIKHSKADSAQIKLISDKNQIQIIIKDNGVGFNFSQSYNEHKSLGLKTIKERVKFLNGSLKINSKINEGTTLTILFSLE
jgi:signal transduction histidine kinase